jgi:hypothetical protein
MTIFNLPDKDELKIQMQKRIAELEKANQDLRAEILECKKVGETLKREQSLLGNVMQATDFVLAFFDLQFNFVWVNPAHAESCHMKSEEMVSKNHFVLYLMRKTRRFSGKSEILGRGILQGQDVRLSRSAQERSHILGLESNAGQKHWQECDLLGLIVA